MKKFIIGGISTLSLLMLVPFYALASSYNGSTVSPESDGKTYTVTADAGDTVTLTSVGSSGGQIVITFKNNISGTITVEEMSSKPSDAASVAPGSVNTYFNVTLNGIANSDIQSSKWKFSVSKDWLQQQGLASSNVFLYHYGSSWQNLTTRVTASTDTSYTYESDVTSFSPFAVAGSSNLTNAGAPFVLIVFMAMALIIVIGASYSFHRTRS